MTCTTHTHTPKATVEEFSSNRIWLLEFSALFTRTTALCGLFVAKQLGGIVGKVDAYSFQFPVKTAALPKYSICQLDAIQNELG